MISLHLLKLFSSEIIHHNRRVSGQEQGPNAVSPAHSDGSEELGLSQCFQNGGQESKRNRDICRKKI